MNNNTGSNYIAVAGGDVYHKPKGLIEALSEIERYAVSEKGGTDIDRNYFTTQNTIDFFEVGFKGTLASGLVGILFIPFAIGVMESRIPVFASYDPSLFDLAFVFLLALFFSIGNMLLISSAGKHYTGTITKQMIRWLLGGVIAGGILEIGIAFVLYHWLYLVILTGNRVESVLLLLAPVIARQNLPEIYNWIMAFKPILLESAWLFAASTLIFVAIPVISAAFSCFLNKKPMNISD